MNVIEHRTKTEITGGITVVTALADIPRLYLAVDNTREDYAPDLSWLMEDCASTPYREYRT